ncbi:MAG: hypothetical protein ABW137_11040 [Mycobacterium sp.]
MKKLAAVLSMTAAMAALPFATTPIAQADVCAGAAGRHVAVGGCTNIVGDVATGVAIASSDHPYVYGEVPCYTVEGVPYYTPPGDPC